MLSSTTQEKVCYCSFTVQQALILIERMFIWDVRICWDLQSILLPIFKKIFQFFSCTCKGTHRAQLRYTAFYGYKSKTSLWTLNTLQVCPLQENIPNCRVLQIHCLTSRCQQIQTIHHSAISSHFLHANRMINNF